MTEKTRENLRDVALAMSVAISLASALGVMIGKTNADAQWVQTTNSRLAAIEKRNAAADISNAKWRVLIAKSVARANYLCVSSADCNRYFARFEASETE